MPHPPTALIAIVVAVLTAGAAASQNANKAAQTVKDVMQTMTIPASDEIFSAASEPPKDETQWVALRSSAATLAESGRLLTTTGPAKEETEWREMARALVTEAEATFKAIDAKDPEGLAQVGDRLYVTCKACHDRYLE
jgi:hypothetical protein